MKKALFAIMLMIGTSLVTAAQYFDVDGISYAIINDDEVKVEISNYSGNVIIPETVANEGKIYRVTAIADRAFKNCYSLTNVSIPNSVKSIGDEAFYYCSGLTGVTIPNSVESMGTYAFFYCENLATVTIGNGLTEIKDNAFFNKRGFSSSISKLYL